MKRLGYKAGAPARRQRQRPISAPVPQAYSYHARRDDRKEEEGRKQPAEKLQPRLGSRPAWLSRPIVFLVLFALVILCSYKLSLSTYPDVRILTSGESTNSAAATGKYVQAAAAILNQSVWSHSKLTVNTQRLSDKLLHQFPEIESVSVSLPFLGSKPLINIVPSRAVLLLTATNGTYAIDDRGKAIGIAPPGMATAALPVLTDQSNLGVRPNKQVLTASQISFISIILQQLKAKQVQYSALVLPSSASEVDVYIGGQPYFVKFNMQASTAREQVGTFLAAQQELARGHIAPMKYIDVRVEGRAYYQ